MAGRSLRKRVVLKFLPLLASSLSLARLISPDRSRLRILLFFLLLLSFMSCMLRQALGRGSVHDGSSHAERGNETTSWRRPACGDGVASLSASSRKSSSSSSSFSPLKSSSCTVQVYFCPSSSSLFAVLQPPRAPGAVLGREQRRRRNSHAERGNETMRLRHLRSAGWAGVVERGVPNISFG